MKIGLNRKESATEVWSVCTMETFVEKVKRESKGQYISQLREALPSLQGTKGRFASIDKIPLVYPVAEFRRMPDGGRKFKRYNGIVVVEVNQLSGILFHVSTRNSDIFCSSVVIFNSKITFVANRFVIL